MKRRWGDWPGRTLGEINSTSGLFALVGGGVAATGLVLSAPIVLGLGGVLVLGTGLWCVAKGLPPAMATPKELIGQRLDDLRELDAVAPRVPRVGFVGASGTGKSTLLAHLQAYSPPAGRTEDVHAYLVGIPGEAETYFALIDAAGQQYSQQFKVIDEADSLIVFVDHARGDSAQARDPQRIAIHDSFLDQLSGHLRASGKTPRHMHFLLNKRDLWELGTDAAALEDWFNGKIAAWTTAATNIHVTHAPHSNRITDDITALVNVLRAWAQRGRK